MTVRSEISNAINDRSWPGITASGGEIFLAATLRGDMLHETRSESAASWQEHVGAWLVRNQNKDGSWTGSSCINGRSFCTSAAVLAALSERAAVPAQQSQKHERPLD